MVIASLKHYWLRILLLWHHHKGLLLVARWSRHGIDHLQVLVDQVPASIYTRAVVLL